MTPLSITPEITSIIATVASRPCYDEAVDAGHLLRSLNDGIARRSRLLEMMLGSTPEIAPDSGKAVVRKAARRSAGGSAIGRSSLLELLDDPRKVDDLDIESIPSLVVKLSAVLVALGGRMASEPLQERDHPDPEEPIREERWITAEEAASITGLSKRWFYMHWKDLPFARKPSKKIVRFEAQGLHRWLASRRP